ncbi:MAG: transcription repressor NadR [Oscillospiraceae bacterium]|nr:transcription repressor NadR [Oscillospiraceae bacterium]
MKAEERRKCIAAALMTEQKPLTGGMLSERFGVSRQIIVQDIAALKASGYEILATHHGYLIQKTPLCERVFKVRHSREETEDELNCIVSLGGMVADVYVWHKVYGRIVAPLNICTAAQVRQFIDGVRSGKSVELMNITGGYHYHTIRADSEEVLDRVGEALQKRGFIAPEI